MRTRLAFCAVVAMFGLTAAKCTPEQVAEVEAYYRASIEAERAPKITVTATCETLTVHGENWPDGSTVSIGIESEPGIALRPVGGVVDFVVHVWDGHGTYIYTVAGLLPGALSPAASEWGPVECGPGLAGSGEWGTPP